jgi:hypothetical protein
MWNANCAWIFQRGKGKLYPKYEKNRDICIVLSFHLEKIQIQFVFELDWCTITPIRTESCSDIVETFFQSHLNRWNLLCVINSSLALYLISYWRCALEVLECLTSVLLIYMHQLSAVSIINWCFKATRPFLFLNNIWNISYDILKGSIELIGSFTAKLLYGNHITL